MHAGVAPGVRRGAAVSEQVSPGAVQQVPWNDIVGLTLGDEHRHPGQPGPCQRDARVERQSAVQDRGAGEPLRLAEH